MTTEPMCYVASQRDSPDAAYAIVVDEAVHAKDVAKAVASWIREGAIVQRVPVLQGKAMMMRGFELKEVEV